MPLSLHDLPALRQTAAQAFRLPSTQAAWQLGLASESPSCAFFCGYQAAIRCLDPSLPPAHWGAFAISESGVKTPWQMHSRFCPQSGQLSGKKSYVMLAKEGLDALYVVASEPQDDKTELWLLRLTGSLLSSLDVLPAKAVQFMPELPHYAVRFDLVVPKDGVLTQDAHRRANKPFRYWEDVHVALALAGWLSTQTGSGLEKEAQVLEHAFLQEPAHYHLAALDAVETLLAKMAKQAQCLPENWQSQWQRDVMLLKFGEPVRQKIRTQLLK